MTTKSEAPDLSRAMKELCEAYLKYRDRHGIEMGDLGLHLDECADELRAALAPPKPLRTESERNAELVTVVCAYYRSTNPQPGQYDRIRLLVDEPTRPDPPPAERIDIQHNSLTVIYAELERRAPTDDIAAQWKRAIDGAVPPAEPSTCRVFCCTSPRWDECVFCREHAVDVLSVDPPPAEVRGLESLEREMHSLTADTNDEYAWSAKDFFFGDQEHVRVLVKALNRVRDERRWKAEPQPVGCIPGAPGCENCPSPDPQRAAIEAIRVHLDIYRDLMSVGGLVSGIRDELRKVGL